MKIINGNIQKNNTKVYSSWLQSIGIDPNRDINGKFNELIVYKNTTDGEIFSHVFVRQMQMGEKVFFLADTDHGKKCFEFENYGDQLELSVFATDDQRYGQFNQIIKDSEITRSHSHIKWTKKNITCLINILQAQQKFIIRLYSECIESLIQTLKIEEKRLTGTSKRRNYIEKSLARADQILIQENGIFSTNCMVEGMKQKMNWIKGMWFWGKC